MRPLRVLLLHLETTTWRRARHWSYSAQLGIEEGFRANQIEFFTVTTPWFRQARQILRGQKFDQVWVEIGRQEYMDEDWLDWMASMAPIRIGMMFESLEHSTDEHLPAFRFRKERVLRRLRYITHVTACDEFDVDSLNSQGPVPSFWWPQAIPNRFIATEMVPPTSSHAIFCGSLYRDRVRFLNHPELNELIVYVRSPERGTVYPLLFNALHLPLRRNLKYFMPPSEFLLQGYLRALRFIREKSFVRWLKLLQSGCAVVNLPHLVKSYPGRVVEGMAAGRPVISWQIPDRPRTQALFEEGREILLFTNPSELAEQIRRVRSDAGLAQNIVSRATLKLKCFHTIEKRVRQVLDWIETGENPKFN